MAMAFVPVPPKLPAKALTPPVAAQPGKSFTEGLSTVKCPPPVETAIGTVAEPLAPVRTRAARPLPVKSPTSTLAPWSAAHLGKRSTVWLVTVKVPSPFENATGIVVEALA